MRAWQRHIEKSVKITFLHCIAKIKSWGFYNFNGVFNFIVTFKLTMMLMAVQQTFFSNFALQCRKVILQVSQIFIYHRIIKILKILKFPILQCTKLTLKGILCQFLPKLWLNHCWTFFMMHPVDQKCTTKKLLFSKLIMTVCKTQLLSGLF